jgi:hypothetical protein
MTQYYEIPLNCDNSFCSIFKNSETGHTTIMLEDKTLEISRGRLIIGDTQMLLYNRDDSLCVNYLWVIPTSVLLTFVLTFLAFISVLYRNKKKRSREFAIV